MSFAFLVGSPRTRPGMIDLLAGRIYGDGTDGVLQELTLLADKARLGEVRGTRVRRVVS